MRVKNFNSIEELNEWLSDNFGYDEEDAIKDLISDFEKR